MDKRKSEPEEGLDQCPSTGRPTSECPCLECSPMYVSVAELFTEVRTVSEAVEKLQDTLEFYTYLLRSSFEIEANHSAECVRVVPPIVGRCYWIRCEGCGYPILLDEGNDPDDCMCESCCRTAVSRLDSQSPRYYDDLFSYLDLMLSADRECMPLGPEEEDLPLVKEFCESHGFDFDAIRARLNSTGGYDDAEVLMNSARHIPGFDRLPKVLSGFVRGDSCPAN